MREPSPCGLHLVGAPSFDVERPLADRWVRYWPNPYTTWNPRGPVRHALEASEPFAATIDRHCREALRLLYVGWTRARDRVVLGSSARRGAHLHVLETPREVRNALVYVLRNSLRHGVAPAGPFIDVYSSGGTFDGWRQPLGRVVDDAEPPVVPPRVWLLTTGWKRGGLISFDEEPSTQR